MFETIISDYARSRPEQPALSDAQHTVTYRQMAEDIARASDWLKSIGSSRGERIVLHIPSTYMHWVMFFAIEAIGGISIAIFPSRTISEQQLDFLNADRVLTGVRLQEGLARPVEVLDAAWAQNLRLAPLMPMPKLERSKKDPICIVLSSGTTGEAKKVMLTREMIDRRVIEQRTSDFLIDGSRVLLMLPAGSIGGLISALSVWAVGATLGDYSPDGKVVERLALQRPTVIAGAPTHLNEILQQLPDDFVADPPIHVSTGGGALPIALAKAIARKLGGRIGITYGSTEMGYVARGDHDGAHPAEGAVGSVLGHAEVEIRDEDQNPVPFGELGQVWVRGGHVVDGFLDDLAQTSSLFRDGWFHPGDLGVLESDGRLFIKGRTDDLLNFRGLKMLTSHVEQRVVALENVREAAVFLAASVDDEEPHLWVVYSADMPIDPSRIVPALQPGVIFRAVWTDSIPRNAMGKADRVALQKLVRMIRPA